VIETAGGDSSGNRSCPKIQW